MASYPALHQDFVDLIHDTGNESGNETNENVMKECMYYVVSVTKGGATQNKTHVPSLVLFSCTYSQ